MMSEYNFLQVYQDIANDRFRKSSDIDNLYFDLQNKTSGTDLEKWFEKSVGLSRLDKVVAIDAVAHAIHQGGNDILQQVYPGADSNLFKTTLDELAGLEKTSDVRKTNRGFFSNFLNDNELIFLEKQTVGQVTKEDIGNALREYEL